MTLHDAIEAGQTARVKTFLALVRLLVERGAKIAIQANGTQGTPQDAAKQYGHAAVARFLARS